MKMVKCSQCGWVHVAISRADAEEQVASVNLWLASSHENSPPASMDQYLHCFRCGAPFSYFVLALPGDAPSGATLQACVLE